MRLKGQIILVLVILIALIITLAPWISGLWLEHYIESMVSNINHQQSLVRAQIQHYHRGWLFSQVSCNVVLNHEAFPHLKKDQHLTAMQLDVYHGPLIDHEGFLNKNRWHWAWGIVHGVLKMEPRFFGFSHLLWEGRIPFYGRTKFAFNQPAQTQENHPKFQVQHLQGLMDYQIEQFIRTFQLAAGKIHGRWGQTRWALDHSQFYYKLTYQDWYPHWITWQGGKVAAMDWQGDNNYTLHVKNLRWLGRHWQIDNRMDLEQHWQVDDIQLGEQALGALSLSLEFSNIQSKALGEWLAFILFSEPASEKQKIVYQLAQVIRTSEFILDGWFLKNRGRFTWQLHFPYVVMLNETKQKPWWQSLLEAGKTRFEMRVPKHWVKKELKQAEMAIPEIVEAPPRVPKTTPTLFTKDAVAMWLSWAMTHNYIEAKDGMYHILIEFDGHRWLVNNRVVRSRKTST